MFSTKWSWHPFHSKSIEIPLRLEMSTSDAGYIPESFKSFTNSNFLCTITPLHQYNILILFMHAHKLSSNVIALSTYMQLQDSWWALEHSLTHTCIEYQPSSKSRILSIISYKIPNHASHYTLHIDEKTFNRPFHFPSTSISFNIYQPKSDQHYCFFPLENIFISQIQKRTEHFFNHIYPINNLYWNPLF